MNCKGTIRAAERYELQERIADLEQERESLIESNQGWESHFEVIQRDVRKLVEAAQDCVNCVDTLHAWTALADRGEGKK